MICLTLSWRRPLSMDSFLYDNGLRHEGVKKQKSWTVFKCYLENITYNQQESFRTYIGILLLFDTARAVNWRCFYRPLSETLFWKFLQIHWEKPILEFLFRKMVNSWELLAISDKEAPSWVFEWVLGAYLDVAAGAVISASVVRSAFGCIWLLDLASGWMCWSCFQGGGVGCFTHPWATCVCGGLVQCSNALCLWCWARDLRAGVLLVCGVYVGWSVSGALALSGLWGTGAYGLWSRELRASALCLPRFILLGSFSDTLLVVSILNIVYDCHL